MLELMGDLPMDTAITSSRSAEFSELALLNHQRHYENFTDLVAFLCWFFVYFTAGLNSYWRFFLGLRSNLFFLEQRVNQQG